VRRKAGGAYEETAVGKAYALSMGSGKGDLGYASEKTGVAVHLLATSHGTLQQRLLKAWTEQGHYALPMGLGQGGIPMSDDLIRKLEALNERMSSRPARTDDEGTFAATILSFTDEEASEAAEDLCEINLEIQSELEEHRRG